MKREDVKVGMVVWNRMSRRFEQILHTPFIVKGVMHAATDNLDSLTVPLRDLRPLTKRERGES